MCRCILLSMPCGARQHPSVPLLDLLAYVLKLCLADLATRIAFFQDVEGAFRAVSGNRLMPATAGRDQPPDEEDQSRDEHSPKQEHHEHHPDSPTPPHHVHAPGAPVLPVGRSGVGIGAKPEGHNAAYTPPPVSYIHSSP